MAIFSIPSINFYILLELQPNLIILKPEVCEFLQKTNLKYYLEDLPSIGCVITSIIPSILDEDSYYFYIGINLGNRTYTNLAISKNFVISKIRLPRSQLKYFKIQKIFLKKDICYLLKRNSLSINVKYYKNSCVYVPDNQTTIYLIKDSLFIERNSLKLEIPQNEILLKVYKN